MASKSIACPECSGKTSVTSTCGDGARIYRVRECNTCGHRISTCEVVADGADAERKFRTLSYSLRKEKTRRTYEMRSRGKMPDKSSATQKSKLKMIHEIMRRYAND